MKKKLVVMPVVVVGCLLALSIVGFISPAHAAQFNWKLQSAHPAGAPQIVLLNRMADDIEKMSGGRLKIEILASGAIVKPFEILEGVNKGITEAGQWWTHYSMGKNPAGSLFSSPLGGSGSGLDLMNHLSWYLQGQGRDLYVEYYQKVLNMDVMPFMIAPDGPEAFGWSKVQPKTLDDYLKERYRMSSGLSSDVLKDMGGTPVNMHGAEIIPARSGSRRGFRPILSSHRPETGAIRRMQELQLARSAPGDRHPGHHDQRRGMAVAAP